MSRTLVFFPVLFLLIFSACHKTTYPINPFDRNTIIAWNEDTVLPYHIALLKNNKFSYTISVKNDPQKIEKKYYSGFFRKGTDTFYLTFSKNNAPLGMATYMIREFSGHYLIQYFSDGRRKMFLRIFKPPLY